MSAKQPFRECPRFDSCSVNRCPLDAAYPHQPKHVEDKQQDCPMEKGVRVRIAEKYPGVLSKGGLTVREYAGSKAFASIPLAVKARIIAQGKANVFRPRQDQ